MTSADLLVDLELTVRQGRSPAHRRARHILSGRSVTLVSAGAETRIRTVDVREWRSELADARRVPTQDEAPTAPDSGLELPWDLVVGTGAAWAAHRPDLHAALVARADASLREHV